MREINLRYNIYVDDMKTKQYLIALFTAFPLWFYAQNIGIGTQAPADLLHLNHTTSYKMLLESPIHVDLVLGRGDVNRFANVIFSDGDPGMTGNHRWALGLRGTENTSNFFLFDEVNSNFMLTATQDARIGINRSNPQHPLQVGTNSTNGNSAHVTTGGVWTNGSDRNSKHNITPVVAHKILEKLAMLPIARWQFLGEDEEIWHLGPMAQDFHAVFGLGGSDMHIGTVDADGVALASIQALYALVQEQESEIAMLRARIGQLEQMQ